MARNDNYKSLIDDLGGLRAEMAELLKKEKEIKKQLNELGVGTFEGDLYRVAIFDSVRKVLNMKAVRAKLSPQFIRANTKEVPVRNFKPSARNGSNDGLLLTDETEDA